MTSRIGLEAVKATIGASTLGTTLLYSIYGSALLEDGENHNADGHYRSQKDPIGRNEHLITSRSFDSQARQHDSMNSFPLLQMIRTSCDKAKHVPERSTVIVGDEKNVETSNVDDTLNESENAKDEDEFPNLTRHGSSLLRKHLTPQVFERLHHLKTSKGVTLEDMIRGGVSLPLGRNPPRGVGVYAGDAECYKVFAPLLFPIIDDYHKTNLSAEEKKRFNPRLQRQTTNLNPEFVLTQRPDPTGEYILYTRMRASRSIEGFNFAPSLSRSDRRKVELLMKECVSDWKDDSWLGHGKYKSLWDMTNQEHDDLIQRHILFHDPDEWAVGAGLGRDWPDGRGLFCNVDDYDRIPDMMLWCNAEDHIRVVSMNKGGDIKSVFTTLSRAVQAVDKSLQRRGYLFAYDDNLGFLNTCPTNLGTGLRVHVFVKLVRLGREPGFHELVKRLRLHTYSPHDDLDQRYTGIFDVCNSERLGKNEVELINIIIQGVGKLIALEQKLERGESVDCSRE